MDRGDTMSAASAASKHFRPSITLTNGPFSSAGPSAEDDDAFLVFVFRRSSLLRLEPTLRFLPLTSAIHRARSLDEPILEEVNSVSPAILPDVFRMQASDNVD